MFQNYMRRLFWLILGVAVSSIGIAMMLQANVGLEPWSVLQQGMSLRTGMTYGTASIAAVCGDVGLCCIVLVITLAGRWCSSGIPLIWKERKQAPDERRALKAACSAY